MDFRFRILDFGMNGMRRVSGAVFSGIVRVHYMILMNGQTLQKSHQTRAGSSRPEDLRLDKKNALKYNTGRSKKFIKEGFA
jgi:hypothetical protein